MEERFEEVYQQLEGIVNLIDSGDYSNNEIIAEIRAVQSELVDLI